MKRLAIIVLAGSTLALGGCDIFDPKVDSPFSGKPVNEAGLAREIRAEEAKAKAEADAKLAEAAEQVRQAKARLIGTNIALQQKASVTAAEIQATAATVEFETGAKLEGAKAAAEAASKALADRLTLINQQGDDAFTLIEEKRQKIAGIGGFIANIPGIKQAAGTAGIDLQSLLAIGLGGSTLYAARRAAKNGQAASNERVEAERKASLSYDQGVADERARQDAAREREHAAWDASRLELHQLQAPAIPRPA